MEFKKDSMVILPKDLTKEQCTGTGMAMVLIMLILAIYTTNELYIKIGMAALIINMMVPYVFYPLAVIWFGLANLMGAIMSKVILTILFMLLVVPVGVIRRLTGYDAMLLTSWKKSTVSVFKDKHKSVSAADLEKPY